MLTKEKLAITHATSHIMRTILKDTFETNLGEIEFLIKSEYEIQYSVKDNLKIETENHKIEVLVIDLNELELD